MTTASRYIPAAARYFMGALFTVIGVNGFFHFLPQPPPPAEAMSFLGALFATGYFFPLLKGTEIVAGLLLLGNRYVPLALTVLAPIIVNIVAYHAFLAPVGMGLALVVLLAELYLAWAYRDAFAPMLQARVELNRDAEESARVPGRPARATG